MDASFHVTALHHHMAGLGARGWPNSVGVMDASFQVIVLNHNMVDFGAHGCQLAGVGKVRLWQIEGLWTAARWPKCGSCLI
eukprot:1160184-Pelagomonas_calceolata.AAC.6